MSTRMAAHDVAAQAYRFWTGATPGVIRPYKSLQAFAWLAMQDGETSFRYTPPPAPEGFSTFPVGDHGKAHGPFQHQPARIGPIKTNFGVDLLDPNLTLLDGLRAADWEASEHGTHPYHVIRAQLEALTDFQSMIALLVHKFEQSEDQERDTRRRKALGDFWINEAAHNPTGFSQ